MLCCVLLPTPLCAATNTIVSDGYTWHLGLSLFPGKSSKSMLHCSALHSHLSSTSSQHTVSSYDLVPLDTFLVVSGIPVPCDCVLLQGEAVVNEAALTGESVPCRKVAWPEAGINPAVFCPDRDRDCVLFAGTQVLQVCGVGSRLF